MTSRQSSTRKRTSPRPDSNGHSPTDIMLTPNPSHPAFVAGHAPLTPRTPKSAYSRHDETEMSLLSEGQHLQADLDLFDDHPKKKISLSLKDKRGMALLCVLCEFLHLFLLGPHHPSLCQILSKVYQSVCHLIPPPFLLLTNPSGCRSGWLSVCLAHQCCRHAGY